MPDPDYKALCAELLADYEQNRFRVELAAEARAALEAQPEPAPTDEELEDLAEVMNVSGNPVPAMRRALELWGNSQGILDSSPHPEPVAPTDEELLKLLSRASGLPDCDTYIVDGGRIMSEPNELLAFARAVLACWGTPANTTREENLD
jgi:hypothetical protein